ncbi:MAG TPA: hypothetical protein VF533_20190 [Solirubrobacteraceae bacterium]|jgi:hypothetical protein
MSRPARLLAIGFAVFAFLAISALLARALTGTGTERAKVIAVVRAEARGDAGAVLARLPLCRAEPACVATVRRRVAGLRRPGDVKILTYSPSVNVALTRQEGTGRVAWRAGDGLPVVQCVRVRREGPLTGGGVTLVSVGPPLPGERGC